MKPVRRVLWSLFVVFDALVLVLWGAGYLGHHISPARAWVLQLVAIGFPYLSLLVGVLTVGVGLARRRGLLLVHLLLVLLAGLRFLPTDWRFAHPAATDADLVVMTYNAPTGYEQPGRARRLQELVETAQPHILCLQESSVEFLSTGVQTPAYIRPLFDSLGYQAFNHAPGTTTYTQQPILSRLPLREMHETLLQMGSEDESTSRVMRTVFTWQGREVVLYNLHLRTYGEAKLWDEEPDSLNEQTVWGRYLRQYREAILARAWASEQITAMVRRETHPVLVCGDFNSTPHNWEYRQLAAALQDVFHEAGQGWGGTYHTRLPLVRIDFVLADTTWLGVSAAVLPTGLSDHRPLVARLRWKE